MRIEPHILGNPNPNPNHNRKSLTPEAILPYLLKQLFAEKLQVNNMLNQDGGTHKNEFPKGGSFSSGNLASSPLV